MHDTTWREDKSIEEVFWKREMAWVGVEFRELVICLLLMVSLGTRGARAQQQYNNVTGYACTGAVRNCRSYAYYRTQGSQSTLASIATIFNTSAAGIANASGIDSATTSLPDSTPLYIPLSCGCADGAYRSPTSHVVALGETMYIIANQTYQGMTTYQAIQIANPSVVAENMQIGQVLAIPLRCACPSTAQRRAGSTLLLSYSIFPLETLSLISARFNVSVPELQDANNVTNPETLLAFSTLLIPLATLPPLTLAVPPPPGIEPAPVPASEPVPAKDASKAPLYIGVAVGAVGLAVAMLLACLLCMTHRHYKKIIDDLESKSKKPKVVVSDSSAPRSSTVNSSFVKGMSAIMGSEKLTQFTYEEILNATNLFSDLNRIQGSVFMGKLNRSFVAIKQMKGNMSNELRILSQVHHGNVVRLVGMCACGSENLYLVFEYAENGSLSDCLHHEMAYPSSSFSRTVGLLSWKLRVQIASDVASGLEYLHNYTNPSLVHKDVKSSNILLDENFRAKVANFGMARSASTSTPMQMTKHIVGTQGYMAPEYLEHGMVTTKIDVFSFGVVLLELLSGREATFTNALGGVCPLSETIVEILQNDDDDEDDVEETMARLQAWMDARLQDAYPREIACNVAKLAKSCVDSDPARRPDMKDCSFALSKMCQASQDWDSARKRPSAAIEAR